MRLHEHKRSIPRDRGCRRLTVVGALILQQLHDLTDAAIIEAVAFNITWHFLDNREGIGGEFERLAEVRLQAEGTPDPRDRGLGQPGPRPYSACSSA